jgi:hypothetical protein
MTDINEVAPEVVEEAKPNGHDKNPVKDLFHASIQGQVYEIGPLKCKHLRQISVILKDKSAQTATDFSSVERWMPFVFDSLKLKNADITQDLLDNMTLQEFNDTWEKIVAISGVSVIKR